MEKIHAQVFRCPPHTVGPPHVPPHPTDALLDLQQAFGYTQEELRMLMEPMATTGFEPTGSMGDDTPTAGLSTMNRRAADHLRQSFAQVEADLECFPN